MSRFVSGRGVIAAGGGSGGARCLSLGGYVTGMGPMDGATAAGGRSCCLSSRRCPQSFLLSHHQRAISAQAESRASANAGSQDFDANAYRLNWCSTVIRPVHPFHVHLLLPLQHAHLAVHRRCGREVLRNPSIGMSQGVHEMSGAAPPRWVGSSAVSATTRIVGPRRVMSTTMLMPTLAAPPRPALARSASPSRRTSIPPS